MLTVAQMAEVDQLRAAIRDFGGIVLGLHEHAAKGAIRLALTWDLGGVEVLVGHDLAAPDQLVLILEGGERQVFNVSAASLGAHLPQTPERFADARDAVRIAIQTTGGSHAS